MKLRPVPYVWWVNFKINEAKVRAKNVLQVSTTVKMVGLRASLARQDFTPMRLHKLCAMTVMQAGIVGVVLLLVQTVFLAYILIKQVKTHANVVLLVTIALPGWYLVPI